MSHQTYRYPILDPILRPFACKAPTRPYNPIHAPCLLLWRCLRGPERHSRIVSRHALIRFDEVQRAHAQFELPTGTWSPPGSSRDTCEDEEPISDLHRHNTARRNRKFIAGIPDELGNVWRFKCRPCQSLSRRIVLFPYAGPSAIFDF